MKLPNLKFNLTTLVATMLTAVSLQAARPQLEPKAAPISKTSSKPLILIQLTKGSIKAGWVAQKGDSEHGYSQTARVQYAGFAAEVQSLTDSFYNQSAGKNGLRYWILKGDQTNTPAAALYAKLLDPQTPTFKTRSRTVSYYGPLSEKTTYSVIIGDASQAVGVGLSSGIALFDVPKKPNVTNPSGN